jgi:hypothetical protein
LATQIGGEGKRLVNEIRGNCVKCSQFHQYFYGLASGLRSEWW